MSSDSDFKQQDKRRLFFPANLALCLIVSMLFLTYAFIRFETSKDRLRNHQDQTLQPNDNNTESISDQVLVNNLCSWSGPPYAYPYWTSTQGDAFVNTVKMLNDAGVAYFLTDGALIGAYRHGGPVPCDGDMDIVFPTWLNGLADCDDVKDGRPNLRDDAKTHDENKFTLCGKTRTDYVSMTGDWLRTKVPSLRSIQPRSFGGLRVDFAGIGVDWIVSIYDQSYMHDGPMCRCQFGDTWAWCIEGSLTLLKRIYGENVMKPVSRIKQCLLRGQTQTAKVIRS